MRLRFKFLSFLLFATVCSVFAQTEKRSEYVFKQEVYPMNFETYYMTSYFNNSKEVYNIKGYELNYSYDSIVSVKINPSGTSYAVITKRKGKSNLNIYDLWQANTLVRRFKNINDASAICYTPDAKTLVLARTNVLKFYDARAFFVDDSLKMNFTAKELAVSGNNYFISATDGDSVCVWNAETKRTRLAVAPGKVNGIAFSGDSKMFGILTDDSLCIYDTRQFALLKTYNEFKNANSFAFHPNGKHISLVANDTVVNVLNIKDDSDRFFVDNSQGGTSKVAYVSDNTGRDYMVYNTNNSLIYRHIGELVPNRAKLLENELQARMNEWMKKMPDETEEEYGMRVNDETRMRQMTLFEQEISTRMADNFVSMSNVALGNYIPDNNLLEVSFDNMPTIYLPVPKEDLGDFMSADNLEFRNAKYGLTSEDKFELTFAEVYNKATGKTYVFDNTNRASLELLVAEENFVPLELVQLSNMQEVKLTEMKDDIVSLAKSENVISDYTNISVVSDVVSDYNADGESIVNYVVGFSYEVEKIFSVNEDFAPGKYKTEESGAATSMLNIIKRAMEQEFTDYIKAGKKLNVKITGMADAIPIVSKILYDGSFGPINNEPVYKDNELSNITLPKGGRVMKNEELAFLRAMSVKNYIETNIPSLSDLDIDYTYHIDIASGKGGEYRRIGVVFTFVDAF